jgi:uncharacterized protein YkwD
MGIVSRIKSVFRRTWRYFFRRKRRYPVNSKNKIILSMINKERRKRNLRPLIYDHDLELHAIRWSGHMAHQKRLSHSRTILENVCMVPANGSLTSITKSMFYCWKESKPHWGWMMDARISKAGFGYSIRGKYAYGAFAFNNPRDHILTIPLFSHR